MVPAETQRQTLRLQQQRQAQLHLHLGKAARKLLAGSKRNLSSHSQHSCDPVTCNNVNGTFSAPH